MAPAGSGDTPNGPPQDLREYDPEFGAAFASGAATASSDHAVLLGSVKVPVLFSHHFHVIDERTGTVVGAISDLQVHRVEELVTGTGNSFTYKSFPQMPHSMHTYTPAEYVDTVIEWVDNLALGT